jgi:hypothetical protein
MSINEAANKAAADTLLHEAPQQVNGYAPPPQGVKAEQVIDYLLVHYGHAVEQNDYMRGRVWQLEAVNDNHLRSRQEMCDDIVWARQHVATLTQQLADANAAKLAAEIVQGIVEKEGNELLDKVNTLREQVAVLNPRVNAVYSYRGKPMQRDLRVIAVQTTNGQVTVQVDLRGVSRVGAN